MDKKEDNNINNNITSTDALTERLNKIKKSLSQKEETQEVKNNIKSDPKELAKLKEKLKMENAPPLKEIKDIEKNMQKIKSEFTEANNTNVSKEKFSSFINNANEMFKNYEKQLQYYSTYNGKYNTKDLTISSSKDISLINDRNFYILSDKKKEWN